MYRLDSHIHCQYSPDSSTKIDDIIKKSIEDKIDIIAISDHNTVEGSKVAVEKTKDTENLLVIPSIEISSSKGHILGFGCEEVVPRDLEPEETIDMIHDQGGLAIIPHPFCFFFPAPHPAGGQNPAFHAESSQNIIEIAPQLWYNESLIKQKTQ